MKVIPCHFYFCDLGITYYLETTIVTFALGKIPSDINLALKSESSLVQPVYSLCAFFQYLHLLSNSEELYVILFPTILPLAFLFFMHIFIQHLLAYHALILGLEFL